MATQSGAPPNPMNDKPQTPSTDVAQPIIEDHQDVKTEATKEISSPSVFVNSEPMREDQVQNAVKFLSHPKVSGSPVVYRRSFLERKGLTKEEIDEAFRRVPDPTPSISTGQSAVANQDGQSKPLSNIQQQAPTQALQPAASTSPGGISKVATLTQSRFHWQQALLAVSLLVISGTGTAVLFKNAIVPWIKSWIRKVVLEEDEDLAKKLNSKPSLAEEAAAAAKAAAVSAADVARASQEMLISKTGEKRYFEELMNLLNVQVQEMKSMSNAIKNFEGKNYLPWKEDNRVSATSSQPSYANGKENFDMRSVRPLSPPASVEPSVAPHPKSYMEIMAMIQRGEKPSNIREINDSPPNPNQPVPNPRVVPRPKPWEVGQVQNGLSHVNSTDGWNSKIQENGLFNNQSNGDGTSVPWWQPNNVRITEIKSGDENRTGSFGVATNERPVPRSWVPPLPPPVAMPEAAAAIRQPKKSTFQNELLLDDQLLSGPSEITDELQRITKISESGGAIEASGGSSVLNSEIQTGEDNSLS